MSELTQTKHFYVSKLTQTQYCVYGNQGNNIQVKPIVENYAEFGKIIILGALVRKSNVLLKSLKPYEGYTICRLD